MITNEEIHERAAAVTVQFEETPLNSTELGYVAVSIGFIFAADIVRDAAAKGLTAAQLTSLANQLDKTGEIAIDLGDAKTGGSR